MADFMQIETKESDWIVIDGTDGVFLYPYPEIGILEAVEDYGGEAACCSVDIERGWCARYSAPGFLDCTDWTGVYADEESAIEWVKEIFGGDEEGGE